jgi:hypothetical protein
MADTVYELYRSGKVVWVEDELTREVLTILWGPCRFHVAIGGSKDGVAALVAGAPMSLRGRVFGIEDLDFARPNRDAWHTATTLRLTVHEAENLVLDPDAIAAVSVANRGDGTPSVVADRMLALARSSVSWMACRAVLRVFAETLHFPKDPAVGSVNDSDTAARFIRSDPSWASAPTSWAAWSQPGRLEKELVEWEKLYLKAAESGDWRASFSGKEILRGLRSDARLKLDATPRNRRSTPAERDLDLAKMLAHKMVELGRVPGDVSAMRDALLAR